MFLSRNESFFLTKVLGSFALQFSSFSTCPGVRLSRNNKQRRSRILPSLQERWNRVFLCRRRLHHPLIQLPELHTLNHQSATSRDRPKLRPLLTLKLLSLMSSHLRTPSRQCLLPMNFRLINRCS